MNTIIEKIAFITIRAKKEGETDDQALVFGAVHVPVEQLSEWEKYQSDKKKFEELKNIARRDSTVVGVGEWEFWLARKYPLKQLQELINHINDNKSFILWNPAFASDPFAANFLSGAKLDNYIPYINNEVILSTNTQSQKNFKELSENDGFNNFIVNELRYFLNIRRIIFYKTSSLKSEDFLNAPTANTDSSQNDITRSRVAFTYHKINNVITPFINRCRIHAYVRLIANAHSDQQSNKNNLTQPTGSIIASRKSANFKKLFLDDGSMGFDDIEFGVTTAESKSRKTVLKSTLPTKLVSFFDSQHDNLEKIFGTTDGTTGSINKIFAGDSSNNAWHTSGKYGAPAFKALGLQLDRDANLSHGFGLRRANGNDKLLLRFETVHHLKNSHLPGLPDGVPVDFASDKMRHALFIQEQSNEWDDLLSVPSSLKWVVALTGFADSASEKHDLHLTPFGVFSKNESFDKFIDGWNKEVASTILNAITQIKDGQNLSTLPKFETISKLNRSLNWALFGFVTDNDPGNRSIFDDHEKSKVAGFFLYYVPINYSLVLAKSEEKNSWPELECTYEAFLDHEGKPLKVSGLLKAPDKKLPTDTEAGHFLDDPFQLDIADTRDVIPGIRFKINQNPIDSKIKEPIKAIIRLGAFDFVIPQFAQHDESPNALFDVLLVMRHTEKSVKTIPRIEFKSRLTAISANQVAEDLPQRDIGDISDATRDMSLVLPLQNNDRAIIIPLSVPGSQQDRYYVLDTYERIGDLWSHSFNSTLEAHIISKDATDSNQLTSDEQSDVSVSQAAEEIKPDAIYISREPFQVVAAQNMDLFSKVDAGGDPVVAVWTPEIDSGRWELKMPSQRVTLFLPPQAVGESMEKSNEQEFDLDENRRADFRFSPITVLEIDPSNLDTVFCEPALNLQRLLGHQAGIRSGVGLYTANFELLYGMNVELSPKNEVLSEAPMRLAEVEALNGRPAPLLNSAKSGDGYENRWGQIRSALASKLAVLDISIPFRTEQRRFEEGVVFRLRNNADLKHPVLGYKPDEKLDGKLPYTSDGLAGGVTWPFESANIVRNLWQNPQSDAAMLDRISLSALGGYGHQRGEFNNKRTVIETVTAMGRVHRYQLERIGRISCLWNRAKHVIVYERSVVPSPQFVNESAVIGINQDLHTGRPVLRKVEEFIELLEPIKRFDEDKSNSTGFICGAAFRSQKIRVDSRWGRDVRQEKGSGWEVPLWRREFLNGDDMATNPFPVASLYPKPQIDLLLMNPAGKEISCEITEPEKLRFYTSTDSTQDSDTSDTSKWPAVMTVDYSDAAEPTIPNATEHPMPLTEGMLPAAVSELAGWNRFTLGLVPNGERIAIGFGRVKNSPSTQLSNVCIARAQLLQTETPSSTQNLFKDFSNSVAIGVQKADLVLDQFEALLINLDPSRIDDAAVPLEAELRRRFKEFETFKEKTKDKIKKAGSNVLDVKDKVGDFLTNEPCKLIEEEINGALDIGKDRLNKEIDDAFKRLKFEIDGIAQIFTLLLNNTALDVKGKQEQALALLAGVEHTITQLQTEFLARFDSIIELNLGLVDDVLAVEPAIVAAKQMLERAKDKISSLVINTDTVTEALNQIQTSAEQTRRSIAPYCQRYPLLDNVEETLVSLINAVEQLIENLPSDSDTLKIKLDKLIKESLEHSIDVINLALGNVQPVFKDINELKNTLLDQKQAAHKTVDDYTNAALSLLENLKTAISNTAGTIETVLQTAVDELNKAVLDIEATIKIGIKDAIKTKIDTTKKTVSDLAKKICTLLFGDNASLEKYLQNFGQKLKSDELLDPVTQQKLNALKQVFTEDKTQIQKAWQELNTQWQNEKQKFETNRRQAEAALESIRTRVNDYAGKATEIHQKGSNALRLIRAVGNPPATPGLDFNRPEVAFVFAVGKDAGIDMTPVVSRINRGMATMKAIKNAAVAVEDTLKSFGVSLPMRKLGDEFTPDALKDFDISRVFPDMGGLKLGGLFKDFKFPEMDDDLKKAIKITHHFDAETRSASLDALLELPLKEPAEIFELGPVRFGLKQGNFNASAKVTSTLRGQTSHTSKGSIGGDFELEIAGLKVIRFLGTKLEFDNKGNTKFDINPKRVELADALQFLVKILQKATADSGFTIEPLDQGGETVGLAAVLDTKLPNLTAGAFGVSNLQFHTSFEIITRPEFEIGVGLSLGSRTRPFILMIAFLAGGGYVLSRTRYIPAKGELTQELAISASAGAAAAFNFGVIEGNVSLLVGIEVAFYWRNRGGQSVAIALYVLANGGIVVLGLLHVDLSLRLEVRYVDNGLSCSGTLTFTVKISCFYKQKVRERVNYQLTGNADSKNYDEGYM